MPHRQELPPGLLNVLIQICTEGHLPGAGHTSHGPSLALSSAFPGHLPILHSLAGVAKMAETILEPMSVMLFTTWCFSDTMLCPVALGTGKEGLYSTGKKDLNPEVRLRAKE